jgi:hypothetical protein
MTRYALKQQRQLSPITVVIIAIPATVAIPVPDIFRIVSSGEIQPRPGSGIRIAPAVIVVIVVIPLVKVVGVRAYFHHYRQRRRNNQVTVTMRG